MACRLIPLNKNSRVRPIGIGEVPQWIIAKVVLKTVSDDVQAAAGLLQTCAGQLLTTGPEFGYHPNANKTHLVVKPELVNEAKKIFENTNVQLNFYKWPETSRCCHRDTGICLCCAECWKMAK